ncbi:hypothetical protein BX666DRAFT_1955635, partial [Dichotomocladium elegans]
MQSSKLQYSAPVWNRDLAACPNMHHIVRSLRSDGSVPTKISPRSRAGCQDPGSRAGPAKRKITRTTATTRTTGLTWDTISAL